MFSLPHLIVGLLTLVLVVETGFLFWLWRRQRRMEEWQRNWQKVQDRQQSDITGLCAAAVRMDERLQAIHRRMEEIHEWARDFESTQSREEPSYHAAIEQIREGAGIDELVERCGFSREEAGLLIRLHRSDPD